MWWLNCVCCLARRQTIPQLRSGDRVGKKCPKTFICLMYAADRCGQTGFLFWDEKQQVNPAKNLGELCRAEFEFNATCFDADWG